MATWTFRASTASLVLTIAGVASADTPPKALTWRDAVEEYKAPRQDNGPPPVATWTHWKVLVAVRKPTPTGGPPPWQIVQPDTRGELQLPAATKWRCAYGAAWLSPTRVDNQPNELADYWVINRGIACSHDGWRSTARTSVSFIVWQDGRLEGVDQAELTLTEAGVDLTVVLRPQAELPATWAPWVRGKNVR